MDRRTRSVWSIGLLALFPSAQLIAGDRPIKYEIVEIGAAVPVALNERGHIAGTLSLSGEVGRSFYWQCATGLQEIDAPSETDPAIIAYDINNRDKIVGQRLTADFEESLPFIWDRVNGIRTGGAPSGIGYEINDWGDVALIAGPASVWNERFGTVSFDALTGLEVWGYPRINNLRQVGGIQIAADGPRFFIWGPWSAVRDLGPVPAGQIAEISEVGHMNERGDLVGTLLIEDAVRPFLLDRDGELQLLTDASETRTPRNVRINNRRQVIGRFSEDSTSFVWDASNGLRSLEEVLADSPDAAKYSASRVADINDVGWMAGNVTRKSDGQGVGALFVPIEQYNASARRISELSGKALCHALWSAR